MSDKRPIDKPTVFLTRHGKTAFNKGGEEDRLKGTKYDLPLTSEGQQEAAKDAGILSKYPIASIEHSPMKRAKQTAALIASATGVPSNSNVALDPWDVGFMSGMKRGSAHALVSHYIDHPKATPRDGEPYGDWFDVFGDALASKMKEAEKTPGKAHVIVTHSCGLLAADAIIHGDDPQPHTDGSMPAPGRIVPLVKSGGKWRMLEDMP